MREKEMETLEMYERQVARKRECATPALSFDPIRVIEHTRMP
jgi:hypothetical protein